MIRAACWYAARDLAVFPVSPNKAPLTPHGFKDATLDRAQIEDWWFTHPEANVGLRCDRLFAVDVDPRSGGQHVLEGWRRVRGDFPRTWMQKTGAGGLHVFFEHDDALDEVPLGRLHRGVDIKGGNRGYVLLAPSRSKSGPYKWIVSPKETKLARAPRWLIDEILTVKTPRTVEEPSEPVNLKKYGELGRVQRARRYVSAVPGAVSGQDGHKATFALAVRVVRGFALEDGEALAVLEEWNQSCQPKWSRHDLKRKIKEARRVGDMPIGALLEKGRAA